MSTYIDTSLHLNLKASIGQSLNAPKRQEIAIQAIGGNCPISHVAKRYGVSRKFVYQQKDKALSGISQAFTTPDQDDDILFHLPVTKTWIRQFVLSQVLICRAPYQSVIEILRDLFDYDISKGSVHNIVYEALDQAKKINQQQDLTGVSDGIHDEIYQAGDPVLAGVCAHSTYCYLLSLEDSCDANAWGVHLLDLREKQNLKPNKTIADGGAAARKGQREAWPDIPCEGDVFHALHPFGKLSSYLENRATDAIQAVIDLKHKIDCPRGKWKQDENRQEAIQRLVIAEKMSMRAIELSDDLNTLCRWLKNDILSLRGPTYGSRKALLEFVIEELRLRESMCKHRIAPVRKYLENHQDNLLEFVLEMEKLFKEIAMEHEISLTDVQLMANLKWLSTQERWEKYATLRERLKEKFQIVDFLVNDILDNVVRASSLVENLNSRLRNYFTLRRHLGNDYLEILRFFLNHRRFMRSEYKDRVGKSPAELLTNEKHPHWLEMLGFELFKQAA
jgi:hypothetical protein